MELATAWITIAANTRGMERDIRRAVARAENGARVNVDGDTDPLRRSITQAFAQAGVQSRVAGRTIGQNLGREAGSALSRELKVALGAVSIGSLPAVSAALASAAGSLQQVSQVGLVLPGVLAGAGTSLATLKLGTAGVADGLKTMWEAAESGDAKDLKKAAEALEGLSPNAKSAVTEVAKLHGSLSKLKSTVQDNMFAGTDQGLRTIAERTLPAVNRGLDQTSKAWGATFRELMRVGGDSSTVSIVDRIFGDTADAQNRANRAISPMVSALGELAATGTGSLPRIADGLTSVSERFSNFISSTASDGRLHQWINEGIDGVSALGRTTLGVGQMFTALTKAAGGGDGLLTALDRGATGLAAFMNSADGQSKLQAFFADGREQLQQWVPILKSIPPIFGSIVDVTATFTSAVLTPFSAFAKFLAEHAGLVKTAAAAWLLFRTVPGIIGGIQSRLGGLAIGTNQVTGQTRTLGSALSGMGATMRAAASANQALVSSNGAILGQGRQLTGHINNWNNGAAAMARGMGQSAVQFGRFGSAVGMLGTKLPVIANMQQAFVRSATAAERFGRTAGTFSAAGAAVSSTMGGIGKAAGGVVNALGGPWGAAFAAAGVAAMLIVSQNQKSAQSFDALQAAIKRSAEARNELGEALINNRGSETSADVKSAGKDRIAALRAELDAASKREGSWWDRSRNEAGNTTLASMFASAYGGGSGRGDTKADAIDRQRIQAQEAQKALDGLKLTQQSLSDVTYGSSAAFQAMVTKLEAAGQGGKDAADKLREARAEFLNQQAVAKKLTPGITELSKAMQVLGDKTASASDKASALKTALDALNPARTAADADSSHTKTLQQIAESAKEAADATGGLGDALFRANGSINATLPNGAALNDTLKQMVDSTADVAAKGGDMPAALAANDKAIADLARQYGTTVEKIKAAANSLGYQDAIFAKMVSSGNEVTRSLGAVATAFAKVDGKTMSVSIKTTDIEAARAQIEKLGFSVQSLPDGTTTITANTAEARAKFDEIRTVLTSGIPSNKPVSVSAPGGQAVFDLLKSMGVEVRKDNDKIINTGAPMAPAVITLLKQLGIEVTTNNDKSISVSITGDAAAKAKIADLTKPEFKDITISLTQAGGIQVPLTPGGPAVRPTANANGSIRSYANGGLNGRLPSQALMQRGRGRGLVQWAEGSTGIESFIPWASNKRGRSTMILSETARAFGYQLVRPGDFFQKFENGGISVDRLKQFASGIQGHNYVWGGGGSTFDADCSGAQATIANFLTGASGRFSTANQAEALAARGFIMGDPPEGTAAYAVGWLNGGPGGGHTSGTIVDPVGGNVNVEMGGAGGNGQYGGQAAAASSFPNRAYLPLQGQDMNSSGGSGASDDSSGGSGGGSGSGFGSLGTSIGQALFGTRSGGGTGSGGTSSKTTAATAKQLREAQDKATDAEKTAAVAKQKVAELEANPKTNASALQAAKDRAEKTERDAKQAKTDLEALKAKGTGTKDTKTGDQGGNTSEFQSLGQNLVSGMLSAIGLDGSVFSNPFEWPNVKSAFALLNWGGGLAKSLSGNSGSQDTGGIVGGAGAGIGLNIPNLADIAKPQTPQTPIGPGSALPLQGGGVTYDFRGANLGVNPKEMTQRIDSRQNAAYRRQSGALV